MEESKGGEASRRITTIPTATGGSDGGSDGGNTSTDIPEFCLCAALVGHRGDVRSLAVGRGHLYSGARDNAVMAWPLDENGHIDGIHTAPAAKITLPDWVNALAVRVSAGQEGEETVVAGCKDGGIYAMVWEDGEGQGGKQLVVKTTLLGHTAPISSLSWSAEGLLLSGSWDETAKAWDLESATCQWTLGGHENNVCVLGLGPGSIATGSTGLNVDGHLVGQQIRMWQGSPPKESRSLTDHTSGIRDLCLADAAKGESSPAESPKKDGCFCSASNDGTVRAWTAEGNCRAIFSMTGAGVSTGGGGTGAVVADVATGSADYAVRVFTADAARWLRDDRLKEAEDALGEGGHVLPSVSDMGVMVGAQDGQLSAFVDEPSGAAQVFRWREGAGGTAGDAGWESLGTLQPPVRKIPFEGGLYDKVIPVEIESASRGFLMFQLGVNRGDDPKQVADAFCQKHSLGPEYLPQIEQFLLIASL
ncbi:unnamed protein product [Scytosiphon promiscuus]